MAQIGLKYPVAAKYNEETGEYTDGIVIAKAIKFDSTPESNTTELYADDGLAEADYSFKKGAISLEIDDLTMEKQAYLLGHNYDSSSNTMVSSNTDIAPFVGVGVYGAVVRNNQQKFRAVFYTKVKFAEPADSKETKGENVSFHTPTLTGTSMVDLNGVWKKDAELETEEEAKEWLQTQAGITA